MNAWERMQYRLLHAVSRRLAARGLPGIRRLAAWIGGLLWLILPGRRALAVRAIAERLNLPEAEARALARRSFEHNALSFLEIVLAPGFDRHRPELRLDDPDLFERLRLSERPIVVATGHLGAWEFTAGLADDFSPSRSRMIVVRNHANAAVRAYMTDMRGGGKRQVVGHRNAVFAALRVLRKNGLVGFLVDHNCGRDEAIFLPFLGRVAAVNVGPAILAVRAAALVLPLFILRQDDHYLLLTEEPLDAAALPGSHEERAAAVARFYTEAVERRIRACPEQWFWMHKRWKTSPPDN